MAGVSSVRFKMKLAGYTIDEFTKILASDRPAPGGGSTAALQGALGAALLRMVAALTEGKEKYKDSDTLVKEIMMEAEKLRTSFIDVMERDTAAFDSVSAVFSMPKSTDEEKAIRRDAMQKALKACTQTPFEMMQLCEKTLSYANRALGKMNTSTLSDFGVCILSLKAALQGAWLNILINIDGINDEVFACKYRDKGNAILERSLSLADRLYESVLKSL